MAYLDPTYLPLNDKVKLSKKPSLKPKLAILDEPASGLDVLHAYHVRKIIKNYVKEHEVTVLLSSHNMLEVEYLCDKVALLDKGKIIVEGSPKNLITKYECENLEEVFAKVVGYA